MTKRNRDRFAEAGAEPALEDLLDDPVMLAILRKDGVSREQLMAVIACARRRLGLGGTDSAQACSSSLSQ